MAKGALMKSNIERRVPSSDHFGFLNSLRVPAVGFYKLGLFSKILVTPKSSPR